MLGSLSHHSEDRRAQSQQLGNAHISWSTEQPKVTPSQCLGLAPYGSSPLGHPAIDCPDWSSPSRIRTAKLAIRAKIGQAGWSAAIFEPGGAALGTRKFHPVLAIRRIPE